MADNYNADEIARQLVGVSPLVDYTIAWREKGEDTQLFLFTVRRKLFTEEMVSICRDMAAVIRREMPERSNGWAALIYADQRGATTMGSYSIGWAGHPDKWRCFEGKEWTPASHADWLAFRDRLQAAVAMIGAEGRAGEGGDFEVSNNERSPLEQTLFVNNPEFLTEELISALQNLLEHGPSGGVVGIFPAFGQPFMTLWEGLEVRADSVIERWDRQEAEELLGDRLKIPRYARDDG